MSNSNKNIFISSGKISTNIAASIESNKYINRKIILTEKWPKILCFFLSKLANLLSLKLLELK